MRFDCEYSRSIIVGGGLGFYFPPPLSFVSTPRSLMGLSGDLTIVLLIFKLSFGAYRHRIQL